MQKNKKERLMKLLKITIKANIKNRKPRTDRNTVSLRPAVRLSEEIFKFTQKKI
jgi:hypothetical protein